MKNYIDAFYEVLHKNSVKRRRMFSLLLVLSLFVSSSVLWELRDIGITMVNEPICSLEEHIHTDECYEDVLVCELEENEEHTHGPECYQRVLTCGMEEHIHTASCFTDEELPQYEPDDYESNVVILDTSEEEEEEEVEESFDTEEIPALQLGSNTRTALDNEPVINDLLTPRLFADPVDNIAKGIKFTLFDYYETGDTLEDAKNNYGIIENPQNTGNNDYGHYNIKYDGVNNGRNANDDILFFAYGTPPDHGAATGEFFKSKETTPYTDANGHTVNFNDYIDKNGNWVDEAYRVPYYNPGTPDKNNYAGDYNSDSYRSGNRPVQGIVNKTLTNGYPTISGSNHSLDYLFSDQDSGFKKVYQNVNYLLKEKHIGESDHLVYNSNENYAYLDKSTGNFTLYDGTYHIINNDHHRAGDTNELTEETYEHANGYEMGIGFFPFNEYDPAWRDPNFNGNGFNHHFGMKMETEFSNRTVNNDPVIFKYSGDDDMWVFIDGVLVLDIGGIHEPAEGLIDFTNGYVWVQDDSEGQDYTEIMNTEGMNTGLKTYEMPNNFGENEHKWIVTPIGDFFTAAGRIWNAAVGAKHTIQVFYLERGGCYSNLSIDMNLPTVKPLSVVKNVDYQNHYANTYDKQTTGGQTYQFEIQELINGEYKAAEFNGVINPFYLKDGERLDVLLTDADLNRVFRVVEKNIDTEVFENVNVNGIDHNYASPTGTVDRESAVNTLEAVNRYTFTNKIRQELKNMTVNKSWAGQSPVSPNIYFKIYRTDSVVGSSDAPVRKPVEIDGTMTFVLNADNNWQQTFSNLPVRYGAHIYTYSVEEINEPYGYEASYSKTETNNTVTLTITNMTKESSYIHVKKQWINAVGDEVKPVQLTLKRKRKLVSTNDATLQINLRDPGGNFISSSAVTNVYAGGSAEFALDVPDNVQYYKSKSDNYNDNCYKTTPDTVECQQLGDRLFRVSNLQAGTNVVDVRIYTDNADDSLLLVHHSFTNSVNGWEAQGGVELVTSSNDAYAKGDALLIKGKTKPFEGAKLKLDPLKFKAGKTYTFNLGVFFDDRVDYSTNTQETNPDEVVFKLSFNDGFGNYKTIKRFTIRNGDREGGGWGPLVGTFTLPDTINPYGMYILVETEGDAVPKSFRMDEFFAIEGKKEFTCAPGTGNITIKNANYYKADFSVDTQSFDKFANDNITLNNTDLYSDSYYLLVDNRNNSYEGAMLKLPFLTPGKKYNIHATISDHNGNGQHQYKITFNNGLGNNTSVGKSEIVSGWGWAIIDKESFEIPTGSDKDNMFIYIENVAINTQTENNPATDHDPYRIIELWIADEKLTQPKEGYDLNNGVYTANNSRYKVAIQEGSISTSDYVEDTGWAGETIYLGGNNPWTWSRARTSFNNEENNYRYIYYIASETVNGATLGEDYILLPIENNYVSANDANTPILVKNKNIRFKLPATGGRGTGGIYIAGTVLIIISLLSGYAVYRQKRRRE